MEMKEILRILRKNKKKIRKDMEIKEGKGSYKICKKCKLRKLEEGFTWW